MPTQPISQPVVDSDPPAGADASALPSIADEFRHGRLDLRGLGTVTRVIAVTALVILAATAVVIVLIATNTPLPGGFVSIAGRFDGEPVPQAWPRLPILLAIAGTGIGVTAAVYAAARSTQRLRRALIAGSALAGAAFGATLLAAGPVLDLIAEVLDPSASPLVATAVRLLGALGLASALAVLSLLARPEYRPGPAAALAAVPFVAALIAYVLSGLQSAALTPEAQAAFPDYPASVSGEMAVATGLSTLVSVSGSWIPVLVVWEAATWAKATRSRIALPLAGRITPLMLGVVVAAKLAFVLAGYSLAGGPMDEPSAWQRSANDGFAWVLAVGFGLLVAGWLARGTRVQLSERAADSTAYVLGLALYAATILAAILLMLATIGGLGSTAAKTDQSGALDCSAGFTTSVFSSLLCSADLVATHGWVVTVAAMVLAPIVGALLLLRRRLVSVGVLLLLVGLWALPRAIAVTQVMLGPADQVPAPSPLTIEIVTMDTVVTAVVAILAALRALGAKVGASFGDLFIVLVVSTLFAHAGTLVPAGLALPLAYAALLFPVAYELTFGSAPLNKGPDRNGRVLAMLGLRVAILSALVVPLAVGERPGNDGTEEFVKVVLGVPITVFVVLVTLGRRDLVER